jgi:hypothetical protein
MDNLKPKLKKAFNASQMTMERYILKTNVRPNF